MPAAADDEEQHCINWIRSGHSFYANEYDMKNNNGHPLNIAEATFMQRLIKEAYRFYNQTVDRYKNISYISNYL